MYSQKNIDNFWKKVNKTDNCWNWTAWLNNCGYGEFWANSKAVKAHRFSFQIFHNRLIQEGMCILHSCDNRKCVNPSHLSEGTIHENNTDREIKGRGNQPKGEKHSFAKLTEKQVKEIREKYSQGGTTQRKLGQEYGVDRSLIGRIIRYESWMHI